MGKIANPTNDNLTVGSKTYVTPQHYSISRTSAGQ